MLKTASFEPAGITTDCGVCTDEERVRSKNVTGVAAACSSEMETGAEAGESGPGGNDPGESGPGENDPGESGTSQGDEQKAPGGVDE